jgi:hypothetical protein
VLRTAVDLETANDRAGGCMLADVTAPAVGYALLPLVAGAAI